VPHCNSTPTPSTGVGLLPAGPILAFKSNYTNRGPHRPAQPRGARISRQQANGRDRLHAAIGRTPPKSQIKSSSNQTASARSAQRHGEAYLFPAAPPPRARRRRRSRGQAPRAQAALHPRALRLHIPRRRRTAHQAAPRVAPRRQAPLHGSGPSRRCSVGGGGGGWRGRWWRVHRQPQLLS